MKDKAELPIDVVIIDNQDVVRAGVQSLVFTHPGVVRSVRALAAVQQLDVSQPPVPVVVLDYWLGRDDESSLDAVAALRVWGAAVLLYTSEERVHPLRQALRAGVDGLRLKNDGMESLVTSITSLVSGVPAYSGRLARAIASEDNLRVKLTQTEQVVLEGLAVGLSPAEIATRLHIAEATVKAHERHIHDKYRETWVNTGSRGRECYTRRYETDIGERAASTHTSNGRAHLRLSPRGRSHKVHIRANFSLLGPLR